MSGGETGGKAAGVVGRRTRQTLTGEHGALGAKDVGAPVAVVKPVAADDAVDEPVVLLPGRIGEAVPALCGAVVSAAEVRLCEGDGEAAAPGAFIDQLVAADRAAGIDAGLGGVGTGVDGGVCEEALCPHGGAACVEHGIRAIPLAT